MKVTVILCTHNRCQSLEKALESLASLKLPAPDEWEVLVVDNNSSDRTREVVESLCTRYPGQFRYFFEPNQGKSHALNSGIREAQGEVLAFTDDDVTVDPDWLQNLTAPLRQDEWAGAGGRVLPERDLVPPRWLSLNERYALGPLALFDLGREAGALTEPPFGNNMAFRKRVFEKYGGFRTDLGPRPGSEIRSEDTEFGRRLLEGGERLRYEPSAVVYHLIPANRLQKEYFLAWWAGKARGEIREYGIPASAKWFVAGVPLFLFRRLAVWTVRWAAIFAPDRRFSCKLKVWSLAGSIAEAYRRSHFKESSGR